MTSQTDTDGWAKSGVMIKESTAAGSKYVLMAVTPQHGTTFQYNFNGDGGSAPYAFPNGWVKLERVGDVFTGYTSANGTNWTQVGQTTLAMGTAVTAGLAVTAHNGGALNTATFDNVSCHRTVVTAAATTGLPTPWANGDVGAPSTSWAPPPTPAARSPSTAPVTTSGPATTSSSSPTKHCPATVKSSPA